MGLNTNIPNLEVRENNPGKIQSKSVLVSIATKQYYYGVSGFKEHTYIIFSFLWFGVSWIGLPDFSVSESHKDAIQVLARSMVLSET